MENKKNEHIKYKQELDGLQWLGLQIDRKTGGQKMGIFMDSIDFNECLKKKKELEKEAESTASEEVREEKVEEKKGKK